MATNRYRCSVLLVDDEPAILAMLTRQLGHEFEVFTAGTVAAAQAALAARPVDVVVTDLQLPDGSGIGLLDWVRATAPRAARVLLTGTARLEDAAEAINRSQVHRLVLKPWKTEDLLSHLRGVTRTVLLERSHEKLLDEYRGLNQQLEHRVGDRTRELRQALAQLEQKNQVLEEMALTDPLTGLPNRRAVEETARKELRRRARMPAPVALGLIDVDHFREINKAHTLDGGDHMLRAVGQCLQANARAADYVGRLGGEEFLVVAPDTDADGAAALAERLRATVERERAEYNGRPIAVTVSLGFVVAGPDELAGFEELYKHAAKAVQAAKDGGRNRAVVRPLPAAAAAVAG
jgi:diguanylate cyclase (GGDEF)-like protein